MKKNYIPHGKLIILLGILLIYALVAGAFKIMLGLGIVSPLAKPEITNLGNDSIQTEQVVHALVPHLDAATSFMSQKIIEKNGHVNLYTPVSRNATSDNNTNSEAMSYYLLWTAKAKDKEAFDTALNFIEQNMLEPSNGHLMWRIESNGKVKDDGSNIATDADLRAIKALLIAEEEWADKRYTVMIDSLAKGIERIAITTDGLLAPYAGMSGKNDSWTAKEVWLSYSDFTVFKALAQRRGEPWISLYSSMKKAILDSQIHNGLYNSELTEQRDYGNGVDGGGYSINSLWIMVRNAESNDLELQKSAIKSLEFYKKKLQIDGQLFALYSSNGDALSPSDSAWVYALVGRAAVALDDTVFADALIQKLIDHQIMDENSTWYGSFPEGSVDNLRVGQFTMQESILTLQDYLTKKESTAAFQQ